MYFKTSDLSGYLLNVNKTSNLDLVSKLKCKKDTYPYFDVEKKRSKLSICSIYAIRRREEARFAVKDPTESNGNSRKSEFGRLEYCIKHQHLVLHPLTLLRRYRDVTQHETTSSSGRSRRRCASISAAIDTSGKKMGRRREKVHALRQRKG